MGHSATQGLDQQPFDGRGMAATQHMGQGALNGRDQEVGQGTSQQHGPAQQVSISQRMAISQVIETYDDQVQDTAPRGFNGSQNQDAAQQRITATHNRGFMTIHGLSREDLDHNRRPGTAPGHGGSNRGRTQDGCFQ